MFYKIKSEIFQVKNLVWYFFFLVLKVLLNLFSNVIHKCARFFRTFLEKNFTFLLYKNNGFVLFKANLVLMPTKANFFLEE